jgi:hypothetical protein
VFDRASKLSGCYQTHGTDVHDDQRAATRDDRIVAAPDTRDTPTAESVLKEST